MCATIRSIISTNKLSMQRVPCLSTDFYIRDSRDRTRSRTGIQSVKIIIVATWFTCRVWNVSPATIWTFTYTTYTRFRKDQRSALVRIPDWFYLRTLDRVIQDRGAWWLRVSTIFRSITLRLLPISHIVCAISCEHRALGERDCGRKLQSPFVNLKLPKREKNFLNLK